MTPPRFEIRRAQVSDAGRVALHRARMFQDMGLVPESLFHAYRARCEERLREMFLTGEYVGWLASTKEIPEQVVAGVGLQLRRVLPHPVKDADGKISTADGRHAIIINVFTEPDWRRQGVARLLMEELIAWARREKLDRLVLHASYVGRLLYEKIGFVPTNEMRFASRLDISIKK